MEFNDNDDSYLLIEAKVTSELQETIQLNKKLINKGASSYMKLSSYQSLTLEEEER